MNYFHRQVALLDQLRDVAECQDIRMEGRDGGCYADRSILVAASPLLLDLLSCSDLTDPVILLPQFSSLQIRFDQINCK